jgi:hypothetical protein
MVDWASGIAGFMEGYNNTVAARSQERDKKYASLMNQAQEWGKVASDFRSRPIQDENTESLIAEAEEKMKKAMFDAEKEMNRKIGGLAKLGGLLNNFLGQTKAPASQSGGGGQDQTQGQQGQQDIQQVEQPPPQLGQDQLAAPPAEAEAPPPETVQRGTGMGPYGMIPRPGPGPVGGPPPEAFPKPMPQPKRMETPAPMAARSEIPSPPERGALTAPPETTPAPTPPSVEASAGQGGSLQFGNITVPVPPPPGSASQAPAEDPLRPSWLPEGKRLNPELFVKDYVQNFNDLAVARKKGDIETEVQLDRQHRKYQQEIDDRTEMFDEKFVPGLIKAGYDEETIQKARLSYVLGNEALMSPKVKTWVDPTSVYDPATNTTYKNVYRINDDGGYEFMTRLNTGAKSQQTTADVKLAEATRDYIAAHPGTPWDEAQNAVRARREDLLAQKLKQAGFKSVKDELLIQYRRDANIAAADARKAKEAGTGMPKTLAQSILVHADSMAKSMFPADELKLMDADEAFNVLLEASNNWLMTNVGLSRDEVIDILRGKSGGERKDIDQRTKDAESMLLSPPETAQTGGESVTVKSKTEKTEKKSGAYTP